MNPGNPKLDNNKKLTRLNNLRNNIKKTNVSQAIPFLCRSMVKYLEKDC